MNDTTSPKPRRRGEPWSLASVFGYASANTFDRIAVVHADPLIGPVLRGLPSLVLGIFLVAKHRTLNQLRPSAPQYIGLRPILAFVAAGIISTCGLFLYYLAMSFGGVTITVPVQETYVIWGTLIAWIFLHERIHRYAFAGVLLIFLGLVGLSLGQSRGEPISPHWYWAIPLGLTTALTYGISGVLGAMANCGGRTNRWRFSFSSSPACWWASPGCSRPEGFMLCTLHPGTPWRRFSRAGCSPACSPSTACSRRCA